MHSRTVFLSPELLVAAFHNSRRFYGDLGWNLRDCSIGRYGDHVRLACDTGAADYFFRDGRIVSETCGVISKLIEFVRGDMADQVTQHNLCVTSRDDAWERI